MDYLIGWFALGNLYLFYRTFKKTINEDFTLFHVAEIILFAPFFPVFMLHDFLMWSKTIKFF